MVYSVVHIQRDEIPNLLKEKSYFKKDNRMGKILSKSVVLVPDYLIFRKKII